MTRIVMVCALLFAANRAAADATMTLQRTGWEIHGASPGRVSLTVGGVAIAASDEARVKLPASKQLVKAVVEIDNKRRDEIWIELRDGHRYTVYPDPCCFLTIADRDDGLDRRLRCEPCPPGTVELDRWSQHGHSCGERHACGPPAVLRVRGERVTASWDEEPVAADGGYHGVAVARESPHVLVVRQAGNVVWQAVVVVRHGGRYTVDVSDLGNPRIVVDG